MNICIFGDSITWGPRLPFRVAWANLLRNHLEKTTSDLYSIYDLGIDGNNTKDLLKRFESEAIARKAEMIIFNIGVNDSLFRDNENNPETSEVDFRKNMQTLIDKAREITSKIMIVGLVKGSDKFTTPLLQSTTGKCYTKTRTRRYDAILSEVATANHVSFVDINAKLSDDDFDDGLHPNMYGHIKIFDTVSKQLDTILKIQHDRYLTLVDDADTPVGSKLADSIGEGDIIRVAGLWIENENGEVLLSKRPKTKRRDPNRWSPAVACMVDRNQTYLEAIKIAVKHEIGIDNFIPRADKKFFIKGDNNFFCQMFYIQNNLKIESVKFNINETQELKWFEKDEVAKIYRENPQYFVQAFGEYLKLYL